MEPKKSNKGLGIGLAALGIIAVAAVTVFAGKKTETPVPATDTTTTAVPVTTDTVSTTPAITATAASTSTYKDGTYTATGSYLSPGGEDQVGVSVTLKDDIIADITVTPEPNDQTSAKYQAIFAANYKPLVIGKKITDVKLSKVSGSSLTSGGFNDALAQIEAKAKA